MTDLDKLDEILQSIAEPNSEGWTGRQDNIKTAHTQIKHLITQARIAEHHIPKELSKELKGVNE